MKKITNILMLSTLILSTVSIQAFGEEKEYESNGAVEFVANDDPTNPVDPENPDPENPVNPIDPTDPEGPNPGTQGPLSIDFASSLDFGKNRISNKNAIYFARAQKYKDDYKDTPNFIQISDNRGTNAGWVLTVKQIGQFKATTETLNNELSGAEIKFEQPKVNSNAQNVKAPTATKKFVLNPDGSDSVVTNAAKNTGAGTWSTSWGTVESITETDENGKEQSVNVTKDVSLSVPGSTPKDAVKYQTKLVWTLSDIPEN